MTADLEQLASLARDEALRHPARTPGRRAAAHLWVSATVPPAKSLDGIRRAVATFGTTETQRAALELLDEITGRKTT